METQQNNEHHIQSNIYEYMYSNITSINFTIMIILTYTHHIQWYEK